MFDGLTFPRAAWGRWSLGLGLLTMAVALAAAPMGADGTPPAAPPPAPAASTPAAPASGVDTPEAPQAPSAPSAASAPEPAAPLASCASLQAKGKGADLRAATAHAEERPLEEQLKLAQEASSVWSQAVARCEGKAAERARRNWDDAERFQAHIASQLEAGGQCEAAFRDTQALAKLAHKALEGAQFEQAARLFAKVSDGWELATEVCSGPQQAQAEKRREETAIDAHNAEFCAPVFQRAKDYATRLRASQSVLTPPERQKNGQIAETLWREAANQCREDAALVAKNAAQQAARERGTPWVPTYPEPEAVAAAPAAAPTRATPRPAAPSPGTPAAPTLPAKTPAPAPTGDAPRPVSPTAKASALAPAAAPTVAPGVAGTVAAAAPVAATAPVGAVATASSMLGNLAASLKAATTAPAANRPDPAETAPASDVVLRAAGMRFEGQFRQDAGTQTVSGRGTVIWDNGDRYQGSLRAGRREGPGDFAWASGQRYSGDWVADQATGQGEMRMTNGDVFKGQFTNGQPDGAGEMRFASGDIYRGIMRNGVADGQGVFIWANGQRSEGLWRQGVLGGQGRLQFANGDRYEGTLEQGAPHGRGTFHWQNGDRYEGEWLRGRRHGQGVFTWANGDQFRGRFEDDRRTEDGTILRKDDEPAKP
ncbi:MAG: hypothetical protein O9335_00365 [Inhella sp.]|uniref:MORN repeat-containing protein n=1 Tax=Inhella sp. TaxID=1921806 RepID=UPI0022C39650|nr:hypothetical protein [Inhella sp.]MCZ8233588.1 hypothetical protein [Inhella sp.]